jgi:ABC-2 type transport system ATP-binding protein
VRSTASDAVLFAALYDDPGGGQAPVLPERLVAPLRVDVPAGGTTVRVDLPAVVRQVAAGHRLRLVVAATDTAYYNTDTVLRVTLHTGPDAGQVLDLPVERS